LVISKSQFVITLLIDPKSVLSYRVAALNLKDMEGILLKKHSLEKGKKDKFFLNPLTVC
jgi:hypothetical protein